MSDKDILIRRVEKELSEYIEESTQGCGTTGEIIEIASGINTVFSVAVVDAVNGVIVHTVLAVVTPDQDKVLIFNQVGSIDL